MMEKQFVEWPSWRLDRGRCEGEECGAAKHFYIYELDVEDKCFTDCMNR